MQQQIARMAASPQHSVSQHSVPQQPPTGTLGNQQAETEAAMRRAAKAEAKVLHKSLFFYCSLVWPFICLSTAIPSLAIFVSESCTATFLLVCRLLHSLSNPEVCHVNSRRHSSVQQKSSVGQRTRLQSVQRLRSK